MKDLKEKTQPEKELERVKSLSNIPEWVKSAIKKKEQYINKPFNKQ